MGFRPVGVSDNLRADVNIEDVLMVARVQELRRKAALCRRVASIPTSGSGNADRILLGLAEQLERDAALREQELRGNRPNRTPDTDPAAP
jgi:hypothetical protein